MKLFAHCGDEACTVSARGRVTRFNDKLLPPHFGPVDVKPGEKGYVSLELPKKTRRSPGRRKVKAIVTVKATDAAGNVATAKRTIKIVKDGCTVCQPPF